MIPETAVVNIESISGWIDPPERDLLYELASQCKRGAIVEIGSYLGKSTACLGLGSQAGAGKKVFAVDPHIGTPLMLQLLGVDSLNSFPTFQANMKKLGLDDIVIPMVTTSEEAAKIIIDPIEIVFVDALHEYGPAAQDFSLWSPKIMPGGFLVAHDVSPTCEWHECAKAFKELVIDNDEFEFLGFTASIGVAQKKAVKKKIQKVKRNLVL